MNEIYLKLKKDIQALTIAGVHLDKKFETKINKLIESVDINKAQQLYNDINEAITTLDTKFKELEKIIENNKSLPNDVNDLQTKVSRLESDVSNISGQIIEFDSKINQNSKDVKGINGNITSINTEIDKLKSDLSSTNDNVKKLQENVGENVVSIKNINSQINDVQNDIHNLKNDSRDNQLQNDLKILDIYTKLGKHAKNSFSRENITSIDKYPSSNFITEKNILDVPDDFTDITSILCYLNGSFTIKSDTLTTDQLIEIFKQLTFKCKYGQIYTTDLTILSQTSTGNSVGLTYYCEFLHTNHIGPISIYFDSTNAYSESIECNGIFTLDRYGIPNSQ